MSSQPISRSSLTNTKLVCGSKFGAKHQLLRSTNFYLHPIKALGCSQLEISQLENLSQSNIQLSSSPLHLSQKKRMTKLNFHFLIREGIYGDGK